MQRQRDPILRQAARTITMLAVVLAGALVALATGQHPARAGVANVYGHSWYITNPTTAALQSLAQGDASWANNLCTQYGSADTYTVLAFGRPGMASGQYAQYDHGGHWDTNSAVESLSEAYADEWYADTSSCPRLHLIIGTANDYECYNGTYPNPPSCSVYTAGQQWANVAQDVYNHAVAGGKSWQESIWSGDDLEAEWDPYSCSGCGQPQTLDFLNGYTAQDRTFSAPNLLVDYGDADYGAPNELGYPQTPAWTVTNVYNAAWGIGWDVPMPEIYGSGLINKWNCIHNNSTGCTNPGGMVYYGLMAECTMADTLPTGSCWTQNHGSSYPPFVGGCTNSPYAGYLALTSASLAGWTNIRWQGDGTTPNNCP